MTVLAGHITPQTSGFSNLGSATKPFQEVHMTSGAFHNPQTGVSGSIRLSEVMEVSRSKNGVFRPIITNVISSGSVEITRSLDEVIISGVTAPFMFAKLVDDQTDNLAINDHVEFSTAEVSGVGVNLSINGGSQSRGIFTLSAGFIWRLTAIIESSFSLPSVGSLNLQWFNREANDFVGNVSRIRPIGASTNISPVIQAEAYIAAIDDVNVDLRILDNPVGLSSLNYEGSYAAIQAISVL